MSTVSELLADFKSMLTEGNGHAIRYRYFPHPASRDHLRRWVVPDRARRVPGRLAADRAIQPAHPDRVGTAGTAASGGPGLCPVGPVPEPAARDRPALADRRAALARRRRGVPPRLRPKRATRELRDPSRDRRRARRACRALGSR